jgi:hypothetical protein
MLAVDAPRQLLEQRLHDLLKFGRLHDVQNLFDLVEEHDLLGRVDLGPVPQQAHHDLFRQRCVLFQELDDTVSQLRMVQRQRLGLVERDEHSGQERLVLLLERERESVDDRTEYFQELGDSVVSFGFVDELEEYVIDRTTDERSEVEEFAVDSVKGGLEEITLSRVFAVEKFQELQNHVLQHQHRHHQHGENSPPTHVQDKGLIDILLPDIGTKVRVLHEAQKELVHDLQMGPSEFQHGFIFLWVKGVSGGVDLGRNGSEQVGGELRSPIIHRQHRLALGHVLKATLLRLTIATTSG